MESNEIKVLSNAERQAKFKLNRAFRSLPLDVQRATRALGYKKLVTYILNTEKGTTLSAAGWKCLGECGGGSWNCKSRPRVDMHPTQMKIKFARTG